MVSPRIVRVLLLLLAGCQGRTTIVASPDAAPADAGPDGPRFGPGTAWAACGRLGKAESAFSLAVSPDGRYLAAGEFQSSIWDLRTGSLVRTIGTDGGLQYAFSRDGELLALTGDARNVYRVADGTMVLDYLERPPNCFDWSSAGAISPDDRSVALGSCSFLEIHALDGSGVARLTSHVLAPGVAYSPDGRFLATSGPELYSADGNERYWPPQVQPPSETYSSSFAFESLRDNTVTFSPDGQSLLVSNTVDKPSNPGKPWQASTQLRRVSDGSLIHDFSVVLPRHPSFSPDGAWIVAGDQLVHVARVAFQPLDAEIEVSAFLPDGRIAAVGKDAVVRLYCPR